MIQMTCLRFNNFVRLEIAWESRQYKNTKIIIMQRIATMREKDQRKYLSK